MAARFSSFVGMIVFASAVSQVALAAEIRVVSANVFTGVVDGVFSDFEHASGHKVRFEYVTAGKVKERVQSGEPGDIARSREVFV